MKLSRRRFIAISAAALAAPGAAVASAPVMLWRGTAMGAHASLTIRGLDAASFRSLCGDTAREIARMEDIFSLYRRESAICRLNSAGRLENPPFDFVRLLSLAGSIHRSTAGAFDPTIQPLWNALAKGAGDCLARQLVGWRNVAVGADAIFFAKAGMAITLNGIAQGYATDRVADLMRSRGLHNVLVSVGEIVANGQAGPGQPWRVGIAEYEDGRAEESIALTDMAIATSSPAGFRMNGGESHILNPTNGMPASHWRRISVLNRSAAVADGLSTAFCIMSAPEIAAAVADYPGSRVIGVANDGSRLELKS